MRFLAVTLLSILGIISNVWCGYAPDLIVDLPGASPDAGDYAQYSGYLNGSEDGNIQLHYWFVESQGDPSTDPLVLWLNGGPGCSSLDGMLYEHGPQLVDEDGLTLHVNPYAWNFLANIIYLESPCGVGFSYAQDGHCGLASDSKSATQNFLALQNFMLKFPEYTGRDLYITGESYGGIYVPTLTLAIYQSNTTLSTMLKGFATGNGLLSNSDMHNTVPEFVFGHGIISQTSYRNLLDTCCGGLNYCNISANNDKDCRETYQTATKNTNNAKLNGYDVAGACFQGSDRQGAEPNEGDKIKQMLRSQMFDSILGHKRNGPIVGESVPCIDSVGGTIYLNTDAVREALHIPSNVNKWSICSILPYFGRSSTMKEVFQYLLAKGIRALVYHGDLDSMCNFIGGQAFVNELGYDSTTDFDAWIVGDQIGGWWQNFGNVIQFTTVRGAGHMVPQYKPASAQYMFRAFLENNYS